MYLLIALMHFINLFNTNNASIYYKINSLRFIIEFKWTQNKIVDKVNIRSTV